VHLHSLISQMTIKILATLSTRTNKGTMLYSVTHIGMRGYQFRGGILSAGFDVGAASSGNTYISCP
jgi:hypothetical protein